MNWFQAIIDFLGKFWPLEVIYSWQRGVRFWFGNPVKILDGRGKLFGFIPTGGLYAFLPFAGHIEVVNVAPDVLRLFDQNVTTKDGVGVMMAANVAYRIVDPLKATTEVQYLHNNLGDACRRHLAKRVRDRDWSELQEDQSKLEKSCRDTMTTHVKAWGVEIDDVGFVCFIRTKNISLTGARPETKDD